MPKNLAKAARIQEKKAKRNLRVETAAVEDDDALFGRTLKAEGNGWFRIAVADPKDRKRIIEVHARVGGRSVARIATNDIVIVAQSGKTYELMGSVSRNTVNKLQKDKRIHPALLSEAAEEDEVGILFERDEEDEKVEEEVVEKTAEKKESVNLKEVLEDADIDAI
jgi:hypothetical protein